MQRAACSGRAIAPRGSLFTQRHGTFACPIDSEIDQLAAVEKSLPEVVPWPLTSIKVTEFPPPAVRYRARNAAEFSLSGTTCIGINRSGFPHGGPRLRRWMSP
jgi:hypothetical protein